MEDDGGANPLLEETIFRFDGQAVPVEAVATRILRSWIPQGRSLGPQRRPRHHEAEAG